MSTFNRIFKEIPYVSADRFEAHNLESKLFFLSHCHADHMIGLSTNSNLPGTLYTSEISAVFIRKQFPEVKDIRTIDIECPLELSYSANEETYKLVVTALPAQHCPGSVMFLFETGEKTILYTGDFRLTTTDLERSKFLKDRQFDVIYLDSTFLSDDYLEFPLQRESVHEICDLIEDWLEKSRKHKILLEIPAQYGSEYLFMEITNRFNQKIFVPNEQWQKYIFFPQMDDCISNDAEKCRIFTKMKRCHLQTNESDKTVRTIKPTAMYWTNWRRNASIVKAERNESYRVAYSNHSSYSEIEEFLNFTQPKEVFLNVVPAGSENRIFKCLKKIFPTQVAMSCKQKVESETNFDNIFIPTQKNRSKAKDSPLNLPPKRLKLL